jgi:ankyrin repeat protein
VKSLLGYGANPNHKRKNGATSLWAACNNGHGEVVKLLVEFGADVEQLSVGGTTPLYTAAYQGHVSAVKTLLKGGASRVHAVGGCIPREAARIREKWDCFEVLS